MTVIVCMKSNGLLVPMDEAAQDTLRSIKNGREVLVEIKTPRNPRHHRLFFGLLNLLVENSGVFIKVEDALKRVKIACGEVDELIDADTGQVFYTLRSIAFASMDQTRFSALFDLAVKVITERWLVGTSQDDLRQRVYELVDGPQASSLGKRVAQIGVTPETLQREAGKAA